MEVTLTVSGATVVVMLIIPGAKVGASLKEPRPYRASAGLAYGCHY